MSGGVSSSVSNLSVLTQNRRVSCGASQPLQSFFLSSGSPKPSLGPKSMLSFEDIHQANGLPWLFFNSFDKEGYGDDDFDEYFHQPEKKRRLTVDQVQFLEKSFEVENKLEPVKKIQLSKDLGLQPRQIAIWFQNRRARWKTKQMEKDYDVLQASYDNLKSDYDSLLEEKDKLKAELEFLSLLLKQKENGNSESSAKDTVSQELPEKHSASENEESKFSILVCKQEDTSSTKSDIFDFESPRYAEGICSPVIEAGDSSYVFEPVQSDLSQDDEDNLSKNLLPSYFFPKLEDVDYSDPPASFEDNAFWSWSY